MTTAETRDAIAAAASTVAGVKCSAHYAAVTKPGAACVRWAGTEYEPTFGGRDGADTWQVIVRLPQDLTEAEKWADAHRGELAAAIGTEIVVTAVTPQQVIFDYGTPAQPCLIVEGHREDE